MSCLDVIVWMLCCVVGLCVWIVYVRVRSVEGGCGVVRVVWVVCVFGLCGVCAFNFVGLILWDLFCEIYFVRFCLGLCGDLREEGVVVVFFSRNRHSFQSKNCRHAVFGGQPSAPSKERLSWNGHHRVCE